MSWPTPQEYNEAIQNPRSSFSDPELQAGTPDVSALGLPRPITGNFASVYRVRCGKRDWAVRCFWREYADMQRRYQEISRHLASAHLPYTVGFEYLPQGIRVGGTWYPVLKMEWVEGELLGEYVARMRHDPAALSDLAERWRTMILTLEQAGIAHGDLQHGNVLVVGQDLKLVDYDAMFVPALAGSGSHEIGHQNYQHPRRNGTHFADGLDRFSAWVVYLSLLGLKSDPGLWPATGWDERLLFHHTDYRQRQASATFRALLANSDTRIQTLARQLISFLDAGPLDIPPLPDPVQPGRRPPRPIPVSTGPAASRPAPAWLSLPDPEPIAFQRSPILVQGIAGSAAVAAVAAVVLALSGALAPLVLVPALVLFLLTGAASFELGYRLEPSGRRRIRAQAEERRQRRSLRHISRRVKQKRVARDAIWTHGDARLVGVAARRDELAREEQKRRSAINALSHDLLSILEDDRAELDRSEREELALTLSAYQTFLLQAQLRRVKVLGRRGPPIGFVLRVRLRLGGIKTAADVIDRASRLARLGNRAAADVLSWRVERETEIRMALPGQISSREQARIEQRYARTRRSIERAERLVRARTDRLGVLIAAVFATEYADLDRQVQQIELTRDERADEIEGMLKELEREEAVAHWRLDRAGSERARLARGSRQAYARYVMTDSWLGNDTRNIEMAEDQP